MRRISFSPLRRLRWRLTLSYTLVTVAALVAVEAIVLGSLLALLLWPGFLPRVVIEGVDSELVPLVRSYLETTPPDVEGLRHWLEQSVDLEGALSSGQPFAIRLGVPASDTWVLVLDSAGRLLGAMPPDQRRTGELFDTDRLPGLNTILPRALAGTRDYDLLFVRDPKGQTIVAVPVLADDGKTLGVLVVAIDIPPLSTGSLAGVVRAIGVSLVAFTLTAGTVGSVFGFLTARGLSHRLGRVAQAADAWSRGDFSVVAEDRSGDELGQLARSLNRMAEQLENLLHAREELAILEERSRLARDLHDSVKQQVFAAAMQLAAAKALITDQPEEALPHLTEAENLTQQAQRELSGLVRELHPAALERKRLAKALEDHIQGWLSQTGIPIDLKVQGERALPLGLEQALFRVAQEALANVARHSQAERAEIRLDWEGEAFTMTVSDDGRGFDPDSDAQGVGLESMRERVAAQGGTMRLRSSPGAGTTLIFSFGHLPACLPGLSLAQGDTR